MMLHFVESEIFFIDLFKKVLQIQTKYYCLEILII